MRARHKPEVERKHCTRSEDMTELQHPEFFVPLEFVSAAPRRIDDDMNVVLAFGKRLDSINCGHVRILRRLEMEIANAILKALGYPVTLLASGTTMLRTIPFDPSIIVVR